MRTFVIAALLSFAAGCHEHDEPSTTRQATLAGANEVPPVTTTATGTTTVVINGHHDEIAVTVTVTGLMNITMAHIHKGAPGVAGPVLFDLATSTFTSPLTKTLTAADIKPNTESFAEAVSDIINGNAYVNVHTMANGGGEIRGNLAP